jgi:hypothetical protein
VEAHWDQLGSYYSAKQEDTIAYVTPDSIYYGPSLPRDTVREIAFHLTLPIQVIIIDLSGIATHQASSTRYTVAKHRR